MKRQWILTSVSALLCCCLFVFMPGNVFASVTTTEGSLYYKSSIVYLYPSNASSTSNADLYASWMISDFGGIEMEATGVAYMTCKFLVRNTTTRDLIIPSTYIQVTPSFTWDTGTSNNNPHITNIEYVTGQLLCDRVNTSGKFYFSNAPEYSLYSYIVVPANSDISCVFTIWLADVNSVLSNFSFTWNTPSIPFTPVQVAAGDAVFTSYGSYIPWIYYRLNTIYDAILDNAQQGTSTDTDAGDAQTEIETIHGTEQTWYTATETALQGTGLSTFTFTGTGFSTTAMADFTALWTNLEGYVIVPTFALSLKLATTVIRHMPRRKRMSEKDD